MALYECQIYERHTDLKMRAKTVFGGEIFHFISEFPVDEDCVNTLENKLLYYIFGQICFIWN